MAMGLGAAKRRLAARRGSTAPSACDPARGGAAGGPASSFVRHRLGARRRKRHEADMFARPARMLNRRALVAAGGAASNIKSLARTFGVPAHRYTDFGGLLTAHSEITMTKTIVAAVLFSLAMGVGPALAQQDQQLPAAVPAATPPAKSTITPEQKAISKACSDQANAKNLHGDERKKFRAECKRKGGKME